MKQIEINDLLKYQYPENLQYNPKGDLLAFQVGYADEKKNTYKRDVHLIKDGKDLQLTSTINTSILFWLDDTHIILRRNTEETQPETTDLYIIDVNGGEAQKWMTLPVGVNAAKRVSDNLMMVTAVINASNPDAYKDSEETKKKKSEEKKKDADYQIVDEVPYWFNGAGFVNKQRTALFEVTVKPFAIKRITSASFDVDSLIVDEKTVYYTGMNRQRRVTLYNKLCSYDTNTKKKTDLYSRNDRSIGSLFVMNGSLYCQQTDMKEYGVNETGRVSVYQDGEFKEIWKPEYSLYDSAAGDTLLGAGRGNDVVGSHFISIVTVEDHNEIRSFDASMKAFEIYRTQGIISCLSTNGKKIAFIKEDWNHLGEVYEIDLKGNNETKLTSLNDDNLKGRYIARPKKISYQSEGSKLHGWVLLPEGFNPKKKYPAVLDVHGGPRAVYTEAFFHEMQVWAAKGFVVMYTNIRGSDGCGDAFADIRDQYGYVDFKNLMDFVDAVLAKYPNIDPKKLCETGGSYGGFMTNWIITHTDRFCAAASQRSISNWISMSFISDIGLYFGPDQCGASGLFGETNTEKLWEHSPLKYADKVKTPTLFIHSDEDYRCPLPEGMQMMQALAQRNIETRMVIFHGENHELSRSGKPLHRIKRLTEITSWFENHTK
jgi:dipeptidyl aminopeptidase/acylaminoacyl peptidase